MADLLDLSPTLPQLSGVQPQWPLGSCSHIYQSQFFQVADWSDDQLCAPENIQSILSQPCASIKSFSKLWRQFFWPPGFLKIRWSSFLAIRPHVKWPQKATNRNNSSNINANGRPQSSSSQKRLVILVPIQNWVQKFTFRFGIEQRWKGLKCDEFTGNIINMIIMKVLIYQ